MIILRNLMNRVKNLYSDFKDLFPFDFFSKADREEVHKFNRSEHMKQLHKEGRYAGTSKIGDWNVSEERRERMKNIREKNARDKESRGYGSEYKMRVDNKNLLLSQYSGQKGYFYLLEFPTLHSIKVGYSKNWEFRTSYQIVSKKSEIPENVSLILSGKTEDLAGLEFDLLLRFQKWTKLDPSGTRYTEFLDESVEKEVYTYILDEVKRNPRIKIEINNGIQDN